MWSLDGKKKKERRIFTWFFYIQKNCISTQNMRLDMTIFVICNG